MNKLMIDNFSMKVLRYHLCVIVNELSAYIFHLFIFGYKIMINTDVLKPQEYLFF